MVDSPVSRESHTTSSGRKAGKLYDVKNYKKSKKKGKKGDKDSPTTERKKSPMRPPRRELVNGKLINVGAKRGGGGETPAASPSSSAPDLATDEKVIDKEYHEAKLEWREESREANERIANWMAVRAKDEPQFVRPFTTHPRFGATFFYTGDAIPMLQRQYGANEKDDRDD